MKIFCYGDSNTYGWDPRGFFGGRYPRTWTDILAEAGHQVTVDAMPGRQIPFRKAPLEALRAVLPEHQDLMILMMGSNDMDAVMDVSTVEGRMDTLLKHVLRWDVADRYLLVGPPENRWSRETLEMNRRMNEAFCGLAEARGIDYVDAGSWDLVLAHDRVHLTEADQLTFAARIMEAIEGPEGE